MTILANFWHPLPSSSLFLLLRLLYYRHKIHDDTSPKALTSFMDDPLDCNPVDCLRHHKTSKTKHVSATVATILRPCVLQILGRYFHHFFFQNSGSRPWCSDTQTASFFWCVDKLFQTLPLCFWQPWLFGTSNSQS